MDLTRLKRFDKKQHDQLEQLISWSTLMGLTGKDLVSLGGHIARAQAREESVKNLEIAQGFPVEFVGKDTKMEKRWSIKNIYGRYTCECSSGWVDTVSALSNKTGIRKSFPVSGYELGRGHYYDHTRYSFLLDVHSGKIVLDF